MIKLNGALRMKERQEEEGKKKKSPVVCKHLFMQAHARLGTVDEPSSMSTPL